MGGGNSTYRGEETGEIAVDAGDVVVDGVPDGPLELVSRVALGTLQRDGQRDADAQWRDKHILGGVLDLGHARKQLCGEACPVPAGHLGRFDEGLGRLH